MMARQPTSGAGWRWAAALALCAAVAGCPKKAKEAVKPAADASPTPAQIEKLLLICEAHARQADEQAFRGCLTRQSVAMLEKGFLAGQKYLNAALATTAALDKSSTEQAARIKDQEVLSLIVAFKTERRQVQNLLTEAGWKAHLAVIARAPKCKVEQVKHTGKDTVTFIKRVGAQTATHCLQRENGSWRIDLAANPETARRIKGLQARVEQAAKQFAQAASALEARLAKIQ